MRGMRGAARMPDSVDGVAAHALSPSDTGVGARLSRHGHPHRTGTDPLRPGPPRRRTAARRPGRAGCATSCDGPDPARSAAPAQHRRRRWPRCATDRAEQAAARAESRVRALFRPRPTAELDNALTTPAPFRERLVWFWTNHFTVSLRRGDAPARGRRLRRGGDPPARHRPVRRHAARGDAPSGDAALPGQRRLGRPRQPGRPAQPSRPEREPGARVPGTAHRQPRPPATPRPT